jgi:hypothetical protein
LDIKGLAARKTGFLDREMEKTPQPRKIVVRSAFESMANVFWINHAA